MGEAAVRDRYGNLFEMYDRITGDDPYKTPMRIYPASHYSMGGLWVDYELQTTIPGLYAIGEANFSDHGANRLGASALMQGLADGYFVIPYTIGNFLARTQPGGVDENHPEVVETERQVKEKIEKILAIPADSKNPKTPDDYHRELGKLIWDYCGLARNKGGREGALKRVPELRDEFWNNLTVPKNAQGMNQYLEKAGRVADFLEFAEIMVRDALTREESCGAHFREESVTEDGEAKRDDENFSHGAVWEFTGVDNEPIRHEEPFEFKYVPLTQRSYK